MKPTLKNLIVDSNIPSKLVRAVVRQSGGWQSFTESAQDVVNRGAESGFNGFSY